MNENTVEIKNKAYTCRNCRSQDLTCNKCNASIKDDNFYLWLILTRLLNQNSVTISYLNNLSNKATNIIELLKRSIGLTEGDKKTVKLTRVELEMRCSCGNMLKVFVDDEGDAKKYDCRKCRSRSFVIISKNEIKIEKTEVLLEKIPAIIAVTGG